MGIINIRPATRGGSKAIIGIAGTSGSGKTYTALLMARGMVEHASQIGFLDTENKRGSLYADILDAPFMIGDLVAPFSPRRYAESIKEFQDAGVKVLVIDSVTHEWEGEGGCDDIANAPLKMGKKMANWIGAKREHKSFMNALLQCDMDVICCIRAREKTDFKDPMKPASLGIQPVCEKNFMFEMTASLLMENEGKKQTFLKLPSFLHQAFGKGDNYLGSDTGRALRKWIDEGEKDSPEISKIKSEMLMACERGVKAIGEIWNGLSPDQKKLLEEHKNMCKEAAAEYDRQNSDEDVSTENDLFELYEMKKESLVGDLATDAERIITNKETASYPKLYKLLQSA